MTAAARSAPRPAPSGTPRDQATPALVVAIALAPAPSAPREVLGDPAYYCRFGFELSTVYQITPPQPEWQPHFQVRVLSEYQPRLRGMFTYPEPFDRT